MNFRKICLIGLVSVSVLVLGACGKPPKEKFLSATNEILEAKQLETKNDISIKLDTSSKEVGLIAGILNQSKMQYTSKKDYTNGKEEVNANIKTQNEIISREISLPLLIDLQNAKTYIKAESVTSLLPFVGVPTETVSPFKGKIFEWDIKEGILKWEDDKKLNEQFKTFIVKELQSLPEERYKREKNTIQVTLKEKELIHLLSQSMDIVSQYPFFEITKEDVKDFKKEIANGILKDSSVTVVYAFQGNRLKNQTFQFNLNLSTEVEEIGNVKGTIKLEREILSRNRPFASTFDYTSKENIVPFSEVEKIMDEYMLEDIEDEEGVYTEEDGGFYIEEEDEYTETP